VIRINRLGVLAAIAAIGYAAPVSAQVVYRDRWMEQQEAKIRAELQSFRTRDIQRRTDSRMLDQQDRIRE